MRLQREQFRWPHMFEGSELTPIYRRFSEKKCSSLPKCLMVLVLLLLCTTAVFVSLFLVYYFKYEDRNNDQKCDTPNCVAAAASLAQHMDTSVDPCVDFAEYACGNFYRTAVYKEGRTSVNTFQVVNDRNQEFMKGVLADESKPDVWDYMKHMKNLYKSCLDEAQIENVGYEPYFNSPYAAEWPTLQGASWDGEATFDLDDVIARYELVYIEPVFTYYVYTDILNSTVHMLYLNDPSLSLSREYLLRPRNDTVVMALEKFMTDFAVELGADPAIAQQDAAAVIDLQIQLANITTPMEERRDSFAQINPIALGALRQNYTYMDIPRALRAAFSTVNMTLEDDLVVNINFPSYYAQLGEVLASADNRTLQNLFGFNYAMSRLTRLTKRFREISLEFDKVYSGKTEEQPRWETCLGQASGSFALGMGKEFVREKFSQESKDYMDEMIDHLKVSFKTILDDADWMGDSTKAEAYQKLAAIGRKIGYPDFEFENEDIEERYKELVMSVDNYYENRGIIREYSNKKGLRKLTEPVDSKEWAMALYDVNAYYSSVQNEIAFPAGILQPPFFSNQFSDAMNYGAIGVVIGHEITHGFDDRGSQYDKDGNLRMWWDPTDLDQFKAKGQCIQDQYGAYVVEQVGMNVNGINTQGENIADNGGIKESFSAYKKLVAEKGDQPKLPGLNLNNDQLFFLAYSQLWCAKYLDNTMINKIETGVHAPGRFRILGPLQNSPDFAEAYNCPAGSPMNPEKKCSVW